VEGVCVEGVAVKTALGPVAPLHDCKLKLAAVCAGLCFAVPQSLPHQPPGGAAASPPHQPPLRHSRHEQPTYIYTAHSIIDR